MSRDRRRELLILLSGGGGSELILYDAGDRTSITGGWQNISGTGTFDYGTYMLTKSNVGVRTVNGIDRGNYNRLNFEVEATGTQNSYIGYSTDGTKPSGVSFNNFTGVKTITIIDGDTTIYPVFWTFAAASGIKVTKVWLSRE